MTTPTREARQLLADSIAAQGAQWANMAANVRAGFTNIWIEPALAAIDRALDNGPQEERQCFHRS